MLSAFITHIIWQLLAMGGWLEEHCMCLQLLVSDVFISSPSVWGWLSDPSPIWRWCILMPNVTTTLQLLSLCSSFKGAAQIIWKRYWLGYLQKNQLSDGGEMRWERCGYHRDGCPNCWNRFDESFHTIFPVKIKNARRRRVSLSSRQHY